MKKLYLTILSMVLIISTFAIPVSAVDYDTEGNLVFTGSTFGTYPDFTDPSATPVTDISHEVPDNYHLVGYYVISGWSSRSTCSWIYAPDDVTEMTAYLYDNKPRWSKEPNSTYFYILTNNFFNDNTQALITTQSGLYSSQNLTTNAKLTVFIPCLDSNGDIVRPEPDINFNLNAGYNDSTFDLAFTASSNSYFSDFVDFYLFPSSIVLSSDQSNFVTNEYITEIPLSESALITELGLGKLLVGEWATTGGVIPRLTFVSRSSSSRYSSQTFDPSSFGVPFALLGYRRLHDSSYTNVYITDTLNINLKIINQSHSGVYSYNDLCVVAVVRDSESGRVFTSRFDFSRSSLLNSSVGVVPPSQIDTPDSYIGGTVSDWQSLADYLQYLFQTNDSNRGIQENNLLAYLQSIPWTNFITGGVSASLDDWLPELSDSIDYTFSNLFSDYFIPTPEQMSELEDELEDDREEFEAKFAFIDDVKDEVSFIFETIMRSGDQTRYFEFNLTNYHGVGVVQMNISDKIPANVLMIVKNFITCFLTISVVMHIFKTLPSTIGKMPSGGD